LRPRRPRQRLHILTSALGLSFAIDEDAPALFSSVDWRTNWGGSWVVLLVQKLDSKPYCRGDFRTTSTTEAELM
jgi:hypothetical protein